MNDEDIHERLIFYTESEELANRITTGVGAVASLVGLVVLLVVAGRLGDPWRIVSCSIFGGSLVVSYTISTLYHTVRSPRTRYLFRILDHVMIYVLIAGTYTPFTLVSLQGAWGWSLFGTVWGLAVAGAVFKAFMTHRLRILGPVFYIAMGWVALVAIDPLVEAISESGVRWLFAGGIVYTSGIVFYAWDRIPYNHAIWHVFVLGGSLCHYLAVWWYVLPL